MQNKSIILSILLSFLLFSCSVPKWAKPSKTSQNIPVNAKERARQNVDEGRGVGLNKVFGAGSKSTSYASST